MSTAFATDFYIRDEGRLIYEPSTDLGEWFRKRRQQLVAITRQMLPERTRDLPDAEVRNLWVEKMSGRRL